MDGLYRFDLEGFRTINLGWHSIQLDPIFWALSMTGLGATQILFVLAFYAWPSMRRFIAPCIATIALTGLAFADVIKKLLPRDRPSNLGTALVQEPIYRSSFVSGHTTTAFALATMLLLMTLGTRRAPWGFVALLWAFAVGISRIYRGVHWPTDVAAGACAGLFGSALIYLTFEKRGWLDLSLEREAKEKPKGTSTEDLSL